MVTNKVRERQQIRYDPPVIASEQRNRIELACYTITVTIALLYLLLVFVPFYWDGIYLVERHLLYGVVVPPTYPLYAGQAWDSPVLSLASCTFILFSCIELPLLITLSLFALWDWSRFSVRGRLLRIGAIASIGLALAAHSLQPYGTEMAIWLWEDSVIDS